MHYGLAAEPVCWMEIGYAAGYTTTFLGRPILYREIECRGAGATRCRIVGKPLEQWRDSLDDVRYFQSEAFVNRTPRRATGEPSPETPAGGFPLAVEGEDHPDERVGLSSGFNAASHLLRRVAHTNATVLFLGETGVGKELFAQKLHHIERMAERSFSTRSAHSLSRRRGSSSGLFRTRFEAARSELERVVGEAVERNELSLDELEASVLKAAVEQANGNLSSAAKRIGLTRRQLAYRLKVAASETASRNRERSGSPVPGLRRARI